MATRLVINNSTYVRLEKDNRDERWFGTGDCSDENLLKFLNRPEDVIDRVKFDDGQHIGSILHVYFKVVKDKLNLSEIFYEHCDCQAEGDGRFSMSLEKFIEVVSDLMGISKK